MKNLTRRGFLRWCGISSVGFALAACGVTPTPTSTPVPTNTALPTNTPTLTLTNTPVPTSTATSTPTPTPTPTSTVAPTRTPIPSTETQAPPQRPSVFVLMNAQEKWDAMNDNEKRKAVFVDSWFKGIVNRGSVTGFFDDELNKLHYYFCLYMPYIKDTHPNFQRSHTNLPPPMLPLDYLVTQLNLSMNMIRIQGRPHGGSTTDGLYGMYLDLYEMGHDNIADSDRFFGATLTLMKELYTDMCARANLFSKYSPDYIDRASGDATVAAFDDLKDSGLSEIASAIVTADTVNNHWIPFYAAAKL